MNNSRTYAKKQRKASRYHNAHKGQYPHFNTPMSNVEKAFLFGDKRGFLDRLFRRKVAS